MNLELDNLLKTRPKWISILNGDPRKHLVESEEPYTVYRTLTDLLGLPENHSLTEKIRSSVVEDEHVGQLVSKLPSDWKNYLVKGHDKFDYPPSILLLLFDFGVRADDFSEIKSLLEEMKSLQDDMGRFLSLARFPKKEAMIGSSFCDTHIITEALLRSLGRTEEIDKAISFISKNMKETSQGVAWKCAPNSVSNARGPGRKDDICPQVTLEALRLFSYIPEKDRPSNLISAGNTLFDCWKNQHRPYMFGHGSGFKKLRPPFFWYNIGGVLDATSRYPELVKNESFQDMLSIVISKADEKGLFTPESIYRDFRTWSFGQKNTWSPWTTFYICRILKRAYG